MFKCSATFYDFFEDRSHPSSQSKAVKTNCRQSPSEYIISDMVVRNRARYNGGDLIPTPLARSLLGMRRMVFFIGLSLLLLSCREIVEKEADEKLAAAESALLHEQLDAASESFHDAILLDPDRADAWIGRGMTLTKMGEIEEARIHYEEALSLSRKSLKLNPQAKDPIRRKITLLVLLARIDEAEALAATVAEEHPDPEFAQQLPDLIKETLRDFGGMILPESSF
jgi:tetratricopeptide (TPR) repeat protein